MDDKIKANNDFLWEPRHSGSIPLWENVKISEWKDPQWQLKNSVRSVERLKKVISLSDH
jgi:lysine 2,3-aminomutase